MPIRFYILIFLICAQIALPARVLAQTEDQYSLDTDTLMLATCKRAEQLLTAGRNVDARDLLAKAVKYDPNTYSAHVHELLAEANHNVGNVENSISEYHRALDFKSDLQSATWNLALCYKDGGRYDDAIVWA